MKLIQQSKLFFKEGNSDKVYEIDLCELGPGEYLVNFRYGRRGSNMKEGTKTPESVSREKADAIFFELENEKRKKGYQTETEVFIELPSLEAVEPGSVKGAILQRLQDAVEGKNNFKTEWKTSRVIWKAGQLQMEEAIPFIIKLTTKGDELQCYAGLWTLTQLKAAQAEPLFNAIATNPKQKNYLRNIAHEGLLTILEGNELTQVSKQLLEKLPPEVRFDIETGNIASLSANLMQHSQQGQVTYFSDLYLLCKVHPDILPALNECIKTWSFRPPYFKHIRSIYKLAQVRQDAGMLALLSYRFEKERAMFRRNTYLEDDEKQYISTIEKYVKVASELRNKDSKIAYSTATKYYFQKNAVDFLKNTGNNSDAKTYLKLAVATLLQYSEADYTQAGERPASEYGMYDYKTKLYHYTLFNYPECSESFLLSTILSGNDPTRKLQPNLKYILGKRDVKTTSYYFRPNDVKEAAPVKTAGEKAGSGTDSTVIGSAVSMFKSIFGKKTDEGYQKDEKTVNLPEKQTVAQQEIIPANQQRPELFAEHWDTMPEAYIQLLMQARMNLIHRFAYNNLKARADYNELIRRFDEKALLRLLNSNFEIPCRLGFELLEKRKDEFARNPQFVGAVLNSNSEQAYTWAWGLITGNSTLFLNDLDFTLRLIFNSKKANDSRIDELLQKTSFPEDRLQALTGKVITELLHLENTEDNNILAQRVILRLNKIASSQYERISWNIVEQLMSSPLTANMLLASNIMLGKAGKIDPAEIPLSLVELFLNNKIYEVRENGVQMLNQYPTGFLIENFNFLLSQADNGYDDVIKAVLALIRSLIASNPALGNTTIHYLIYILIRKEKFEGAHTIINDFVLTDLKPYWNSGLTPKDLAKLMHAQYRQSQLTAYEILKGYDRTNDFSLGQIISFGSHEILAVRQWCWNYFKQNTARIRYERDKALNLLDSKWDDTRAYAFHFFETEFTEQDWDTDTLISIVDSIRPDVEHFGKELIKRYFKPENAMEYLTKLSEHPSVNVQAFVTGYLSLYAADNINVLKDLDFYFRSVLTRVNKARVAKDRVFKFLQQESLKNVEAAGWVGSVLDDISAQSTIQDKATCIHILTELKSKYPHLDMHLTIKN